MKNTKIQGLGKAAFEAWRKSTPLRHGYFRLLSWPELTEDDQVSWVKAARAVLKAYGKSSP